MARACGIEGCKKIPEFYCDCEKNNFFCPKHSKLHIKKIGQNHNFSHLTFVVEDDLKEKYLKGIDIR